MKIKNENYLFTQNNWKSYRDYIKSLRLPYLIERSNYTLKMTCNNINISFLETQQPNIVFAAYNKIKSNIVSRKLEPPDIEIDEIAYFNFNIPDKLLNEPFPVIYNVDIKSAYSSILEREEIILPDTAALIKRIPKLNRLVSVGMLASKKNIETYSETGDLIDFWTNKNPLANFFFLCVKKTGDIISSCEKEIGKDFIFSWVDGIYFFTESSQKKISQVLLDEGLKFTFRAYYDFVCKKSFNGSKVITFRDTPGGVKKTFLLPEINKDRNSEILRMLRQK